MRRGVAVALLVGAWTMGAAIAIADEKVRLRDDCDPTDPAWAPTGGCALKEGDVNTTEFNAELISPLAKAIIGHLAWRFDPSYLKIEPDETVEVKNEGGRGHTFTEVANFGGGFVPPLNFGLTFAPACAAATVLPPGASMEVTGLTVGNHRFQCCIHPWMRILIKVKPEESSKDGEKR